VDETTEAMLEVQVKVTMTTEAMTMDPVVAIV
jgi:hypothetical protein